LPCVFAAVYLKRNVGLNHHVRALGPGPPFLYLAEVNFIAAALVLLPVRVDICQPKNGKIGLPPIFPHALLSPASATKPSSPLLDYGLACLSAK